MDQENSLDNLMSQLGDFGRYQFLQHCLHGLAWFLAGIHMMSFVFVFPVQDHRCYVDEYDGYLHNNSANNFTTITDVRLHIPLNEEGNLHSCLKYEVFNGSSTTSCDKGYVYNSTYFPKSRISDWDMVCDKSWMRALLQSIFLFGTLTGSFFAGLLADKFGRKPVFCISGIIQCFCGVSGVFLNNYVLFTISMFWYGLFGASGAVVPSVALTMEIVGPTKRNVCGTLFTVWFGLGAVVVAGWAYFLPVEAHHLQLIYALHSILLFGHYWLMDESICWLWTNGRQAEAIRIAEKATKFNGRTFENRYSLSPPVSSKPQPQEQSDKPIPASGDAEPPKTSIIDLFRYPILRQRTLVMLYCWFSSSLTYFGLTFNSVNLFGNPFVMFLINIVAEVPGHLISIFLTPKTGNKPMFSSSLFLAGIGCLVVGLIPMGLVTSCVTMIAKVAATIAFNVINGYTAELFPTSIRNTAIGICLMSARTGAAIIPEINLLSTSAVAIPTITFGTAGIMAGLFVFFMLPETMSRPIPQTIDDVEKPSKEEEPDNRVDVFTSSCV